MAYSAEEKKVIAALKKGGIELSGEETADDLAALAQKHANVLKYSAADFKKVKELRDAGTPLDGTETAEELDTLLAALELDTETPGEAEEKPGVPNRLTIRTVQVAQPGGKEIALPIYFVAAVKGGHALYDYEGRRVSPAYGPEDILPGSENDKVPTKGLNYINKACGRFNAMRTKNIIPGEASQR